MYLIGSILVAMIGIGPRCVGCRVGIRPKAAIGIAFETDLPNGTLAGAEIGLQRIYSNLFKI